MELIFQKYTIEKKKAINIQIFGCLSDMLSGKKMKKISFFSLVFLLLISWCTIFEDEKIFLSFEETENIVLENIHFLLNENNSFFQFQNYDTQCNIKSDDENMKLDSNISFSGFLDTEKNEALDLYPNIYFFDKKKFAEISTSWLIQNLYHENKYYTKLSWFSIDLWKWNYESNLWYMIIDNLSGKWIRYNSETFDNIRKTQKNIEFLLNTISASSTFENIEQLSYEWNSAYRVAIKHDILNFIKDQTNIEISDFDWLFIVRSNDQVDLKINNMQVSYRDDLWKHVFTIYWIIWEDDGILNFSKGEENIEVSFEMHRKYTKINIKKTNGFNEIWNISFNITKSMKKEQNNFEIKWNLQVSPLVIYWSDLEKQLEINIKCLYENFNWEDSKFIIKEPDSYVLLEQILWDEFSIKNFIWNK